jgi:hypothetical protein
MLMPSAAFVKQRGPSPPHDVTNVLYGKKARHASKFTPQAIEKITEGVKQGLSREEIAKVLDVSVGSLQVTCSRLGISLRRPRAHDPSHDRLKTQSPPQMAESISRPMTNTRSLKF